MRAALGLTLLLLTACSALLSETDLAVTLQREAFNRGVEVRQVTIAGGTATFSVTDAEGTPDSVNNILHVVAVAGVEVAGRYQKPESLVVQIYDTSGKAGRKASAGIADLAAPTKIQDPVAAKAAVIKAWKIE